MNFEHVTRQRQPCCIHIYIHMEVVVYICMCVYKYIHAFQVCVCVMSQGRNYVKQFEGNETKFISSSTLLLHILNALINYKIKYITINNKIYISLLILSLFNNKIFFYHIFKRTKSTEDCAILILMYIEF